MNLLYTKISFDDIDGKARELPTRNVELSEVAFECHTFFALQQAKKRKVLPEGFVFDYKEHFNAKSSLIDLYFASQQDLSNKLIADDLSSNSDSSVSDYSDTCLCSRQFDSSSRWQTGILFNSL